MGWSDFLFLFDEILESIFWLQAEASLLTYKLSIIKAKVTVIYNYSFLFS